MKTQLSLVIALLIITFQAYPQDMQEYLRETNEIVREGNYQEALERHLWFHDHALEHNPAFSGVRLSFALMYWNKLGEVYPPAKIAMIEVRDKKTAKIKDGEGSFYLFQDITALNRTLKEDSKTVELFNLLDDKQPELAKKCWMVATKPVIMVKEYELAKKYGYNPLDEFNELKKLYEYQLPGIDTSKYEQQFKTSRDNHFVEESLHLIEVALELGDENAAKEIQEKAFTVLNDERLHDAIK